MNEITLPQGTIRYRDTGSGDPVVFVHGMLANGELWRDVTPSLAEHHRVIAPDWPLGSQQLALPSGADLSPPALAALIADFLQALDLHDVTLVGNDTGGALCQLAAVEHPERIGRLVLTPCDAFEDFPPAMFKPLQFVAHIPGSVFAIAQTLRAPGALRSPTAYGWLTKRFEEPLLRSWLAPLLSSREIRRQVAALARGFSSRHTLGAAERFGEFTKPVLIAWAREDRFFKVRNAERLAAAFPNARLELIDDSYTFVSLDQPARTAQLIGEFAREPVAA
jgi:pimeloyl-ACP methyl ester carboxylesterase